MRLFVAGLLLLGSVVDVDAAEIRKFPYEAVVDADTVFVHSGPGRKYYATSRLSRSERVTVHRHDPGGWYMIAPPPGSFSWIRHDAVRDIDKRHGVLIDNNVVVRVGSALEDSRDVFQSRLSKGAKVEIVGVQTVRTAGGPVRMLKITPPRGEWRWLPGKAVTPVDQVVRHQHDRDPYRVPSHARRNRNESHRQTNRNGPAPEPDDYVGPSLKRRTRQYDETPTKKEFVERPIIRSFERDPRKATRYRGPTSEQIYRDRDRLRDLDDTFRAMIKHDPGEWDFTELRDEYVELQENAAHSALASQVDLRLASLERYEDIRANYAGYLQFTAKVNHRDAELMAAQHQQMHASGSEMQPVSHTQETYPEGTVISQPAAHVPSPVEAGHPLPPAPEVPPHPPQTYVQPGSPTHPVQTHVLPAGVVPSNIVPTPANPHHPAGTFQPPVPATQVSTPSGSFSTHVPATTQTQGLPKLKGAGIIQRAISQNPHAPRHVLLDPSGRILAYLQATPGLNLDQYLGRQMGIDGGRLHRPDLQMNVFLVQSLRPVNLR